MLLVLTGIGPVLAFELTRVRWKRRVCSMGQGCDWVGNKKPAQRRAMGSDATHSEVIYKFPQAIGREPYGEPI